MSKRDEFFREQKILHLATVDKKCAPHIVPVWYLYSEKRIYVGTNTKTEKAKNLLEQLLEKAPDSVFRQETEILLLSL